MKRSASLVQSSDDKKRHIYVDQEIKNELLAYISSDSRHTKKFRFIIEAILQNLRIPELYSKEEINSSCKGVTAMKLFKGQENDRIYCKEFSVNGKGFIVVCCVLHERKKAKKLSHREKAIIEAIGSYEYEFG